MNNDLIYNFNFNSQNKNTPNNNKSTSKYGEESVFNFSAASFPNSHLNESNGIPILKEIHDEKILLANFNNLEDSIEKFCSYYVSLKNVFNSCDISVKNKLLNYVMEFNDRCKQYVIEKTRNFIEENKNREIINKLKEELSHKKEEINNLQQKYKELNEEFKDFKKKEFDEYKIKLNKTNEQNRRLNNTIEDLEKKLTQKEKDLFKLRENYKNTKEISQDVLTFTYPLGGKQEALDISKDYKTKKDFDYISSTFEVMKNNFNIYVQMLVETSNKALEQFKKIYSKLKKEEWRDSNNLLIKVHKSQTYDINQNLSWTNIMNIHETLNKIMDEIFALVNPDKNYDDPKKLNEDSCEFLLNYIIGLQKLFSTQKEILEYSYNKGDNCEEKKDNLEEFQNIIKDADKFIKDKNIILNNQSLFERFKNELKEENTKIMSLDEYINNMKSILVQAKKISEQKENEFNEYIKKDSQKNLNIIGDIEMQISNTKNKIFDEMDNGI